MSTSGLVLPRLVLLVVTALLAPLSQADEYAEVQRLIRAQQATLALDQADAFLAKKPRDPQMRFLKAVAQSESGSLAQAKASFSALIEDYPELPEPYNNLAVLYAGENQFDKARAALEMAIRANPRYAVAHENLGDVLVQLAQQSYLQAKQLQDRPVLGAKLELIRQLSLTLESK